MFDRLLDFLIQFWGHLQPFTVIDQYNKGIRLRLGKFHSVLEPGLSWKIPFADKIMEHTVVVSTMNLPSQSLTTRDEKTLVVRGVIKYQVQDIKTLILDVYDPVDAISDMTMGIIKKIIMEKDWQECKDNGLDDLITNKARNEAKKWGLKINQVTLTDIGLIRSIKLFNDTTHS